MPVNFKVFNKSDKSGKVVNMFIISQNGELSTLRYRHSSVIVVK